MEHWQGADRHSQPLPGPWRASLCVGQAGLGGAARLELPADQRKPLILPCLGRQGNPGLRVHRECVCARARRPSWGSYTLACILAPLARGAPVLILRTIPHPWASPHPCLCPSWGAGWAGAQGLQVCSRSLSTGLVTEATMALVDRRDHPLRVAIPCGASDWLPGTLAQAWRGLCWHKAL